MAENRLESIESQVWELRQRIEGLEDVAYGLSPRPRRVAPARPTAPSEPRPTAPRTAQAPRPEPAVARPDMEELLGGRVLAWLGSFAVLLGTLFFVGMAISRGWIDPATRAVIAVLSSSALLVAGIWLYERQGRLEAALAMVACALSGLFATVFVATQLYDLIPAPLGLVGAAAIGVVAVAIAVRWDSTVVAAIGILGALFAPVLVGAGASDLSLAFVTIALVASVAVVVWRRWNWLSLGAFAVSAPQLLAWFSLNYDQRLELSLAILVGYWLLYLVAAIGYELRARVADALPAASWLLLVCNVALVATAGHLALEQTGHADAATAWVLGLGAAHVLIGAISLRQPISREIGSLLIGAGLALTAIGLAEALDGPTLVAGWTTMAMALGLLATRVSSTPAMLGSDSERLMAAATAYVALAVGHTLAVEAPPGALFHGVDHLGDALAALGLSTTAAFACGLAWRRLSPRFAEIGSILIGAGFALTAAGLADVLDGPGLVAGWAVVGTTLALLASRTTSASDKSGSDAERLMCAAIAFLALAIGHTLAIEAPPRALFYGVDDLGNTLAALGASAAAALAFGLAWRRLDPRAANLMELTGAATLVYLVSVLIIDTIGVSATGEPTQAGQVWLSAFWTTTGLAAILYGLFGNERRFRLGGLSLLGIAIVKVYTYDLAELTELARVLSFIALGLLLLAGAFAYQRIQISAAAPTSDGR
jgi:uncharacterized membrane protein